MSTRRKRGESHRDFGTHEAVMDLDEAKEWIRSYSSNPKKFAYELWLYDKNPVSRSVTAGMNKPYHET